MNLAEQIEISCLMEATARKPGNVHPCAAFVDLDYDDFVCAAQAIGQPLSHSFLHQPVLEDGRERLGFSDLWTQLLMATWRDHDQFCIQFDTAPDGIICGCVGSNRQLRCLRYFC